MQTITKAQILKFLKDYCYAIYLGVFGAYLFGWVGLVLFGAWGWWNDRKSTLINTGQLNKKTTLWGSKNLHKILNKFGNWRPVYKYFIWGVVTIILSYLYAGFIAGYEIVSVGVELFGKGQHSWFDISKDFTLKMSNLIPFIEEYANHLQKNNLQDIAIFITNVLSFTWFVSLVRLPTLSRNSNGISALFQKYLGTIHLQSICFILLFILTGFIFYESFIGGSLLLSQNISLKNGNFFLVNLFIVLALIFSFLSFALLKNISIKLINK